MIQIINIKIMYLFLHILIDCTIRESCLNKLNVFAYSLCITLANMKSSVVKALYIIFLIKDESFDHGI